MTDARWQRVKMLFAEAMERPAHERVAYLEMACGDDASLRAEVSSLLAAGEDSVSLPRARAAVAAAARDVAAPASASEGALLQRMLETALGQQYEVVRPLGHGGMGAVYLARERALERFVAIKVLRPELAEGRDGRERFRREARIAAQLSHPGIVPLHTFGEVGGLWYYVMGYVRGPSLAERLRLEGSLPIDEAQRVLAELADALECAHRHGVVHRDIKPANVLLDAESGRAVLADFGVAKIHDADEALTASGVALGTPHYMSPEQIFGARAVDERSDIYSLGAVGYRLLAGREPFEGEQAAPLMRRRIAHDPPPLGPLVPATAVPLADVVMRCLARDPEARWQSARDLRAALGRATGAEASGASLTRELPAFGPYALLWTTFWTVLALRPSHSLGDAALLLLVALLVPVGLALHAWTLVGDDLPLRELVRFSFWPPEWWGMWWPRALRRPNDLYPRLPGAARRVRIAVSAFVVAVPAEILFREWLEALVGVPLSPAQRRGVMAGELLLVVGTVLVVMHAAWWARRRGTSWPETLRLLVGATTPSSGWSSPRLHTLLAASSFDVRAPRAGDAGDHLRAIVELAALLSAEEASLAHDVVGAARRELERLGRHEEEIAALERHASAAEHDRLVAQLDALGSMPDGNEARELADVLQRQLEVVQRMRVRSELLARERAYGVELLRGMWRQLSLASAPDSIGAADSRHERLRALLAEIDASGTDR